MPEAAGEPTIRVLYVDDDVALVRLAQKALGRQGFDVVHAANGDEALYHIAGKNIDVIALDHYLTTGTGLDFLVRLSGVASAPAVVYVTGTSEMNVAVAALTAGAVDFVPKTVGDDFLVLLGSALRQAVEKARLKSKKEEAERQVRISRDRAEALLTEVNHRVANSLTLVASLVSLQAKAVNNEEAKIALEETKARIYAISLVHKRLYSSGDVRFVELDEYLSGLLDHLEMAMRSEGSPTSLKYELEPLKLRTDASINLGVVVTEWVTNAFKYAYPTRKGEIRVRLKLIPEGQVELIVEDDGIGRPDDGLVRGSGLGTSIAKAMAQSMGAKIDYLEGKPGTRARLVFPLEGK